VIQEQAEDDGSTMPPSARTVGTLTPEHLGRRKREG